METDIAGFIAALDKLSEEYGVYINSKMSHHIYLVDEVENILADHFHLEYGAYDCFRN